MSLLLQYGANVHQKNTFGETAIFFAVRVGNRQIIQMLVDKGADLRVENIFHEPISYFASGKPTEASCILNFADEDIFAFVENLAGSIQEAKTDEPKPSSVQEIGNDDRHSASHSSAHHYQRLI